LIKCIINNSAIFTLKLVIELPNLSVE